MAQFYYLANHIEDQSFNSAVPYDDLSHEPVYSDFDDDFEEHYFDEASTSCHNHTGNTKHKPKPMKHTRKSRYDSDEFKEHDFDDASTICGNPTRSKPKKNRSSSAYK